MTRNEYGEIIRDEQDLVDLIMQGRDITVMQNLTVSKHIDIEAVSRMVDDPASMLTWTWPQDSDIPVPEFDAERQNQWFMPAEYRETDIAAHVLDLCSTPEELQRAGQELLLFQEHGLMDLLRYLRYFVHVMQTNNVIWGVGRGSSVASFVLFLLGVHRINSLYYDLDPHEFLR